MNERVKEVRKTMKLSGEKFGERLGVGKTAISLIESGKNNLTEQMIISICREFDVNEEWLRYGTGEMFIERTSDEEIEAFIGDLLKDEEDSFKKRLISSLAALDNAGWDILEKFLNSIQKRD